MPSGVATITAPIGPGDSATALALTGVTNMNFDISQGTLQVFRGESVVATFDINATTTVTCTIASGVFTWLVSQ